MYVFTIICEISMVPFEISHKIVNPHTAKYAFYEVLKIWRLMISSSYDILNLSETGPSSPNKMPVILSFDVYLVILPVNILFGS